MISIPYTVVHNLSGKTVMPQSGEVIERDGLILARIVCDGTVFLNTNDGKGFASKMDALAFVNKTMREGATIS